MPINGSTVTYSHVDTKFDKALPGVIVSVKEGEAAKSTVVAFRNRHYKELIDDFGLSDWDSHDERSTHIFAMVGGEVVGSLRASLDSPRSTDAHDYFPDLDQFLPDLESPFLYLSRLIVAAGSRRQGVFSLIMKAAFDLQWQADYAIACMVESALPAARSLGGEILAGPSSTNPSAPPTYLIGQRVGVTRTLIASAVQQSGWTAVPETNSPNTLRLSE